MPIIKSSYKGPPFYMINGHWETVIPSMFFKQKEDLYTRERLELSDGDFLDIDQIQNGNRKCMIISHGLEGGADRFYVKRMAKFFSRKGWDVAAWNCRSCSGEMNRLPRFYHHGDTPDLDTVVQHLLRKGYQELFMVGYSMGGSMTLKYLGERHVAQIKGAAVYSVPCNLRDSSVQLTIKENKMYEQRFLKKLINKIKIKAETHELDVADLASIEDFDTFHDRYTAPLHGFQNKEEFFNLATCDRYFDGIKVPVLIVNAENDPMLGEPCYPKAFAETSEYLHLEIPKKGGHAGFTIFGDENSYMEYRTDWFIRQITDQSSLAATN